MKRTAAAILAAVVLAGCGGGSGGQGSGDLSWRGMPVLRTPPNLPNDRVLSGRIHNGGLRRTRLIPRDLTLVDAHGKVVPSSAIFLSGYLHELYPPTREPSAGLSDVERRRIGRLATLSPGQTVAVTIAWRLKPGQDPPKTAQVKGGSTLPIP